MPLLLFLASVSYYGDAVAGVDDERSPSVALDRGLAG